MAHPYHHSLSSVKKWGGSVFDYLPLHSWFDQSKAIAGDFRHRALRHHAEGIFMLVIWTGKPALMFASTEVVVPAFGCKRNIEMTPLCKDRGDTPPGSGVPGGAPWRCCR
jgi:hypothetical protein